MNEELKKYILGWLGKAENGIEQIQYTIQLSTQPPYSSKCNSATIIFQIFSCSIWNSTG